MFIEEKKQGLCIKIYVITKASENKIVGLYDDALKIKISKPPHENLANKEIVKFLSDILKISKNSVKIIAGHKSKLKKVLILAYENDFNKLKERIKKIC